MAVTLATVQLAAYVDQEAVPLVKTATAAMAAMQVAVDLLRMVDQVLDLQVRSLAATAATAVMVQSAELLELQGQVLALRALPVLPDR